MAAPWMWPTRSSTRKVFGRPGASRGSSAYPQIRFVSLVENGTHVLFGSQMDSYQTGEMTLAKRVLPRLQKGMLCLADRTFLASHCGSRRKPLGQTYCGG